MTHESLELTIYASQSLIERFCSARRKLLKQKEHNKRAEGNICEQRNCRQVDKSESKYK
jgi:hypothetical protein